jgi:beta-glucanase (GH16 family)
MKRFPKLALTATTMALVSVAALFILTADDLSAEESVNFCLLNQAFAEEFDNLSIAPTEIGDKRWIAHTPWNGDFGDAVFTDPGDGFPFAVKDGILSITAKKDETGKWRSGLIASADGQNKGFSAQYGYFEARAKLPDGPGVWPAFWLGTSAPPGWKEPTVEVDVIEYYGHARDEFYSVLHVWHEGRSDPKINLTKVPAGSLSDDFHTYGVQVDPKFITFYLDRRPIFRVDTPASHKNPLLLMANLALGSGWPIDKTPDPSVMLIDYIHAYTFKPMTEQQSCPGDKVDIGAARQPISD